MTDTNTNTGTLDDDLPHTERTVNFPTVAPGSDMASDADHAAARVVAEMIAANTVILRTWLDPDPEVAWDADEPSYAATLRGFYESIGWEGCYHREGGRMHYDVKLSGMDAYRGFRDTMPDWLTEDATREIEDIAQGIQDIELEVWWENLGWETAEITGYAEAGRVVRFRVWGCGRQGGYVTLPRKLEYDPVAVVDFTRHLAWSRRYYNSREWGQYLAVRAVESFVEERIEGLWGEVR